MNCTFRPSTIQYRVIAKRALGTSVRKEEPAKQAF